MSLTFLEAHEAILTHLQDSEIPNVFESMVPAGFKLPTQNNTYLPYLCVSFAGKSAAPFSQSGITSSKDNLKRTRVVVEAVGSSPRDARLVADIARELLEGYEVDESWGELSETLAAGDYKLTDPDFDLWPVRYATGVVFSALTNAVT